MAISIRLRTFWGRGPIGTGLEDGTGVIEKHLSEKEAFNLLCDYYSHKIHSVDLVALVRKYGIPQYRDHFDEHFTVKLTLSEDLPLDQYLVAWDLSWSLFHHGYYKAATQSFQIDWRYSGSHLIECELNGINLYSQFIDFDEDNTEFEIPVDEFISEFTYLRNLGINLQQGANFSSCQYDGTTDEIVRCLEYLNCI